MSENFYITLYVPRDIDLGLLGESGRQLKPEVVDWLNENIGNRSPTNQDWYFNLDNQNYQWQYGGLIHNSHGQIVRLFYFRNENQALLFKLTWWQSNQNY